MSSPQWLFGGFWLDPANACLWLEEGEDTHTIQTKVREQVWTLNQDTVAALLALLDALPEDSPFLQLDAPQRRQRMSAALKQVLLRECQRQPVLLVVEDLHWLDTETQALLESLVESLPTARLLLLVNYRPEYRHGWGSKTYYTQVRLAPLPPASADTLQTLVLARAYQERGYQAYALRLLGEIASRRDSPEVTSAEAHYQQALALVNELGMRPLQAHCHLSLGTLYSRVGRLEEARTELSTALRMYRAMEMSLKIAPSACSPCSSRICGSFVV
jgi:tetratricopeptide (TPR) repeat protein